MAIDPKLDDEILANGDKRNVVDSYRNWKVSAIKTDLASKSFPLHVAVENYQHDFNIGSIVRSANAFNVAGVHIIGKHHWNRRGAMATEKYLQMYYYNNVADFRAWSDEKGFILMGIDNIAGSQPLHTSFLPRNAVYVFGQEGPGLSAEMQANCSNIIAIEQYGSTRSINIGAAAGIILYEWVRQNIHM